MKCYWSVIKYCTKALSAKTKMLKLEQFGHYSFKRWQKGEDKLVFFTGQKSQQWYFFHFQKHFHARGPLPPLSHVTVYVDKNFKSLESLLENDSSHTESILNIIPFTLNSFWIFFSSKSTKNTLEMLLIVDIKCMLFITKGP